VNEESSCPIVPLSASIDSNLLIVVFTRSTTLENVVTFFRRIPLDSKWRSVSRFSAESSRAWECSLEGSANVEISKDGTHFETLTKFARMDLYKRIFCGGSVEIIDSVRAHCEELMLEEKNNSSALLTVTQCLRLTSPFESHSVIIHNLDRLATTLDPLRANMYKSFASHERLRYALLSKVEGEISNRLESILNGEGRIALTYLKIDELHNIDLLAPFIAEIDLRGNSLMDVSEVVLLPLLTSLSMDENPIEKVPSSLSSLSRLEFISAASTCLSDSVTVGITLQSCPNLRRFLYCQTPLVNETANLRLSLGEKVRLIPYYL
ncbi:hypothetical protein PFISCL1PPCAC_15452, partial [Pristionchus fissidentatus]